MTSKRLVSSLSGNTAYQKRTEEALMWLCPLEGRGILEPSKQYKDVEYIGTMRKAKTNIADERVKRTTYRKY